MQNVTFGLILDRAPQLLAALSADRTAGDQFLILVCIIVLAGLAWRGRR